MPVFPAPLGFFLLVLRELFILRARLPTDVVFSDFKLLLSTEVGLSKSSGLVGLGRAAAQLMSIEVGWLVPLEDACHLL